MNSKKEFHGRGIFQELTPIRLIHKLNVFLEPAGSLELSATGPCPEPVKSTPSNTIFI